MFDTRFETLESLEPLKKIVREAARIMLDAPVKAIEGHEKSGWGDFVTDQDVEVQEVLQRELANSYPDIGFIAEEAGMADGSLDGAVFIVDPIDGTLNFVRGRKASAISIAYAVDREVVAALVYDPWMDETYTAIKGLGAYVNGSPIRVSSWPFTGGLATYGSAIYYKDLREKNHEMLDLVWDHAVDFRRSGAASLDLCHIAAGRSDVYCELRLQPWDYAAGALIVQEAGGFCTQVNGQPVKLHEGGSVLAGGAAAWREFADLARHTSFYNV